MDLDNFKFVNDSLGHEVGDLLLVAVTGRIKACLRPEDTIARLGGDEFTVLLEGVASPGYAIDVAERVAEGLRAPFAVASRELHTSASIGIASSSSASDTPGDLLREADLALYAAKSEGKARHAVFDPGMSTQARERLEMESDLRRAMQRGELKVYYQPKVSLKTGKIVSMEALMRWEHPARGLLEPGKFLPLAEETGLILPIGGWVLEEVCRQGKEWRERYPDHGALRVCANVSARQFLQPDFADTLAETLRATGLVPSALSLEIAENTLVGDEETVVAKLRALKDAGVHVVIDDFGAGYSSLSRMGSLPTDILKVDRSLTVNLGRRPEDTAIVAAMIDLGHALGWVVNAHGVETADQLALLRGLGCDMAQGFYFSGPVDGEEASALLAAGSRWG
jgi:diguanylate cyclase (GGDEF)-like protein